MTSRLKPRRSAHFRYMRSSISAQSCDSVPPAPGWIVTMALARRARRRASSWSRRPRPPASSSSSAALEVGGDVLAGCAPTRAARRGRRSGGASATSRSARSSSSRRRRCIIFCASAWLFQKLGRGDPLFDLGELLVEAGSLKDTSAVRPRAAAGLRSGVEVVERMATVCSFWNGSRSFTEALERAHD